GDRRPVPPRAPAPAPERPRGLRERGGGAGAARERRLRRGQAGPRELLREPAPSLCGVERDRPVLRRRLPRHEPRLRPAHPLAPSQARAPRRAGRPGPRPGRRRGLLPALLAAALDRAPTRAVAPDPAVDGLRSHVADLAVSVLFPVFKDERTVAVVAEKALALLGSLGGEHEVIIVDDASPDRSGEIADRLAAQHPAVRVIHHATNRGYGAAIRTGLVACRFEYICM